MRFRKIIRRTIWTIVALATLIALFYAEEDWRGARAFNAAQQDAREARVSLRFADYISPPIPDAENLAALPIFATQIDPASKLLELVALQKALSRGGGTPFPQSPFGHWQRGEPADQTALRRFAATVYSHVFTGTPPASGRAQFEAVYPFIAELRDASVSRQKCRFDFDYAHDPILRRYLALIVEQIRVAEFLTLDALLALDAHEPDVALGDLRTILLLQSGVMRDPSVLAALVGIGKGSISESIVAEGLTLHAWNDRQLAQLQDQLRKVDFLANYRFVIEGELAARIHDLPTIRRDILGRRWFQRLIKDAEDHDPVNFYLPWPRGWVDSSGATLVQYILQARQVADLKNRLVSPDKNKAIEENRNRYLIAGRYILPWNLFFMEMSMSSSNLAQKIAQAQTRLDQSVIACALERYRLVHGSYPPSLGDLQPGFISVLPHAVINGEPCHYQLQADGSYLLYSVGWDQKDNGGKLIFLHTDRPTPSIDFDHGDWVWFGPK